MPPAVPAVEVIDILATSNGSPDVARGLAFLTRAAALPRSEWGASGSMPPATVADLLAAVTYRIDEDRAAVRSVNRTLRAYGYRQPSELMQFLDTFRGMVARGGMTHHAWHENAVVPDAWPIDPLDVPGRSPDASRVFVPAVPASAHHMAYGATVADVVAAWCQVSDVASDDMQRLSDALSEAASDNAWCPVYDRLVDDLNGYLPPHMGELFERARPRRTYWNVDGTVTVTFNLSTTVAASDESEATDGAEFDEAVYELVRELDNRGLSHDLSRYASVDVDGASDTEDDAD